MEVEVGSIYEIDHTKLPPNSPVQLHPIRVAMVIEKNGLKVSLRFPSMSSLRAHFSHGSRSYINRTSKMMTPSLDEKYVMGTTLAGHVLYRKIASEEWSDRRHLWSFWVVPSTATSTENTLINPMGVVSNKGTCLLSDLKGTEMVKWGKRQRVKFVGRHSSCDEKNSSLHCKSSSNTATIDGDDENIEPGLEQNEEEEEEETEKEEEEELEKIESHEQKRKNHKRKCKTHNRIQKTCQNENQRSCHSHKKQRILKNTINRWSEERLKLAAECMLKVMKAKGAVAGSPIMRLELRQESRKWIGDTGLLDHLLKHIAGKVAPGGAERFRRRHNPEGAMEYWLENSDLVRIRREAGVQDTYWVPPSGWTPGDNPSQDPIFAREIMGIKEKMTQMERDMEELKSKKKEENQTIVTTPRSCIINQNMEDDSSSWLEAKKMFLEVVKRNGELEEQVMSLSHSLKDMEVEMVKLKSFSVKQAAVDQELESEAASDGATLAAIAYLQPSSTEKENKKDKEFKLEEGGHLQLVVPTGAADKAKVRSDEDELAKGQQVKATSSTTATQKTVAAAAAKSAEKAARIQRLKSGFRICRPQGTFLWPDMASPSPAQSLVHDHLVVPTTPLSTLSSTTTTTTIPLPLPPPPLTHPPSLLKPLAQRHPIKIKIPIINTSSSTSGSGCNSTPTIHSQYGSKMKATLLDLNNAPSDHLDDTGICGTTSTSTSSSSFH